MHSRSCKVFTQGWQVRSRRCKVSRKDGRCAAEDAKFSCEDGRCAAQDAKFSREDGRCAAQDAEFSREDGKCAAQDAEFSREDGRCAAQDAKFSVKVGRCASEDAKFHAKTASVQPKMQNFTRRWRVCSSRCYEHSCFSNEDGRKRRMGKSFTISCRTRRQKFGTSLFPAINMQPFPGLELQCPYILSAKDWNLFFEFSYISCFPKVIRRHFERSEKTTIVKNPRTICTQLYISPFPC